MVLLAEDGKDERSLLQSSIEDPSDPAPTSAALGFAKSGTRKISKAVIGIVLCLAILGTASLARPRGQTEPVTLAGNLSSSGTDPFELLLERELFDISLFDKVGVPYSSEPEEAKARRC